MDNILYIEDTFDIEQIKEKFENSYDTIINYSSDNINKCIQTYNNLINHNLSLKVNNYKNRNYYPHYNVIYKYLPYVNNQLKLLIIQNISNCNDGQLILEKISDIMESLTVNNINHIIKINSSTWTYPLFLYYLKLIKKCNISNSDIFIINNFCNTDDRIYKYMVSNNLLVDNKDVIHDIINTLFQKNIPHKYILRRLKYLNIAIPQLKDYFDNIISNCISIEYFILIPTILKYYYTSNLKHDIIYNIVNYMCVYYNDNFKNIYLKIYDLLSTPIEKNILVICGLFKLGTSYGKNIINNHQFEYIKPMLIKIFEILDYTISFIPNMNTHEFKNMVEMVGFHNISSCFIINEDHKYIKNISLYYLMPFMVAYGNNNYANHYNKLRYHLSRYIKNIKRKNQIIRKLKLYPIINELEKLKSSTNLTSSYLYPGQLQTLKNTLLLREISNGVIVNNIPTFGLSNIKAEFIEDLDLYLVYDDNNNIINNEEEFILELNKERAKFKEFLNEPYDNYRLYSKPSWQIINIENFIEPFINIINMKSSIKTEGFVLIDNNKEIIIKPKNLYTIDLLYKNNSWIDRDNYKWDIICDDNLKDNQIWRIYPINNNWVAKEIVYDKIKPDSHNEVVNIINLYNSNYL